MPLFTADSFSLVDVTHEQRTLHLTSLLFIRESVFLELCNSKSPAGLTALIITTCYRCRWENSVRRGPDTGSLQPATRVSELLMPHSKVLVTARSRVVIIIIIFELSAPKVSGPRFEFPGELSLAAGELA